MAALVLIANAGCAPIDHHPDIDLRAATADPALHELADRARAGDKAALLELGERYDRGDGLPRDGKRAEALYRAAAVSTGGTLHVLVATSGGGGQVIPVDLGPRRTGLPQAAARLRTLSDRPDGGRGIAAAATRDMATARCAVTLETVIAAIGRMGEGPMSRESVVAGLARLGHERGAAERCLTFHQQVGDRSDRTFVNDELAALFDRDVRRLQWTVFLARTPEPYDFGESLVPVDAARWRLLRRDLESAGWREEGLQPDRSMAPRGVGAPPDPPPDHHRFRNARLGGVMIVSMRPFGIRASDGTPAAWSLISVVLIGRAQ